jgi:DivIVA domain-containing protein
MEIPMAITPQAIKDQEFQVKFRGYDAIEVKAYLELIAEEFFELFEQVRKQAEDIEGLVEEKEELVEQSASLRRDITSLQGKNDRIATELEQKNERNTALLQESEDLKRRISDLERQQGEQEKELSSAKGLRESEKREKEDLNVRYKAMERQWDEQKKVEIDFKDALMAAQTFSRDMKKKSEEEADAILEKARADAEKLRRDTYQELARYPKEIERLKLKRAQVREDLRTVLTLCLENLDIFKEDADEPEEEDYSDLFQSVMLSDDGTVNSEELAKLDMDLDLPDSFQPEPDPVSASTADSDPADV